MDAKKPHLATPEELDRLRSNSSVSTAAEFREICLERRRLRQEEEARRAETAKANDKKP